MKNMGSMKRRDFLKTGAAGVAALGALSLPEPLQAVGRRTSGRGIKAKRVLMLALDGIRADGFQKACTPNLDALMADLEQAISGVGGYVEDQNIHNGSNYTSRRYRNANLTIRIPDDYVEQFTGNVSDMANVVSQNLRREDITLKYVATASRVTALETEETRLLELLAKAETMADLLEIEARLTDVRYELENYASQLRLYDNQVDYATIYLSISEVQEYTPVEEPTFLERIKTTFSNALEGLGDGIVNITVFLVGNSPYLLAFGILGFVTVILVKRSGKIRLKKKAKKEEQK